MNKTIIFNPPHVPDQTELRDYQKECVGAIEKCKSGSHLIVLPTGSGKTFIFSHLPRHGRVLILSHRDELVHQPKKYYDCSFGVEQASEHSNGEEVVSASVQSLVRRLHKFDPYDFDMIITDEAHHAVAPSYRKIYNYFKPRIHIGFTATPDRQDKCDLHEIFEDIIFMRDLKWGIKMGHLTNIECYQANIGYDLTDCKKQMGDYKVDTLSDAMLKKPCIEAAKDAYKRLHKGPTLTFCVSVDHANKVAEAIEGSAVITADTPNRSEILEDFKNGLIPNICSVGVLTEGTDIPSVQTILMLRPTLNSSLYLQIIGRGLRPYPGKEACRLIDCVGVTRYKPVTIGSLFGISTEMVPPKKRQKLNGVKITDMEDVIDVILDSPEQWINSTKRVSFFEEDNDVDLMDINFVPMANGSLHLSLGTDKNAKEKVERTIIIPSTDALGQTYFEIFFNKKRVMSSQKGELQSIIKEVYSWLLKYYPSERTLWDVRRAAGWSKGLASSSQINFINNLAKSRGRQQDIAELDMCTLTKGQASVIITHLKAEPQKSSMDISGRKKGNSRISCATDYTAKNNSVNRIESMTKEAVSGWYNV